MASLHGMRLISCVPNSHSILTSKYHPLKFTCRNKEALFFEAYTNYEQKSYSYQSEIDIMYRYLSDDLSSVRHLAHLPISHMMWHFFHFSTADYYIRVHFMIGFTSLRNSTKCLPIAWSSDWSGHFPLCHFLLLNAQASYEELCMQLASFVLCLARQKWIYTLYVNKFCKEHHQN